MIKKNLKTMIFTSIIILAPIVVGLFLWNQLPEQMATHFDENGNANGWSSKAMAVFGFPVFLLAVHWFGVYFTAADPKRQNISDKMLMLVLWLAPMVSVLGCGSTYMYAIDSSINTATIGIVFAGCLLLVLGNYMPKMKQSYTIGIKIPWTLHSEENWNRTHRFAGKITMAAGIIVMIGGFLKQIWVVFIALLFVVFFPMIYSFLLYKKENK